MTEGFEEWNRRRLSETTSFQALRRSMNPKWTIRRRKVMRFINSFIWHLCFWTIIAAAGVWIAYLTILLSGGFDVSQ